MRKARHTLILWGSIFCLIGMVSEKSGAQCPGSLTCAGAQVFCSASQLQGLMCRNPNLPNAVFPLSSLCNGTGNPSNLNWWAFLGAGEILAITFNFNPSSCQLGFGIQAGVFEGGCDGTQIWDCNANCNSSTFVLSGITKPCEIYYLWVDGCDQDICDYIVVFNGFTGPPKLSKPLPPFELSGTKCPGSMIQACLPDLGVCKTSATWSLDGTPLSGTSSCIDFQIPLIATASVELCAQISIVNPIQPGTTCSQEQFCQIIQIDPPRIDLGPELIVCHERQPFFWHGLPIVKSCLSPPCSVRVTDPFTGCFIDSIRPIRLLQPLIDSLDTFLCHQDFFLLNDFDTIYTECCDSIFKYFTEDGCDSTFLLTLRRPHFDFDWAYNPTDSTLCPLIDTLPYCDKINQDSFLLLWSRNGKILDTLPPDSCLHVPYCGSYTIEVVYLHDSTLCYSGLSSDFYQSNGIADDTLLILGMDTLCSGDSTLWVVQGDMDQYFWSDSSGLLAQGDSLWLSKAGEYCITGWRSTDSCTVTYCQSLEVSSFMITDSVILPDNGTQSGAIEISLSGTDTSFSFSWSQGDTTQNIYNLSTGDYTLEVCNGRGCCQTYTFHVPMTTGVTDWTQQIRVYPNPVSDHIMVGGIEKVSSLTLMDLQGKVLIQQKGKKTLSVGNVARGTYFLRIDTDMGIALLPIIVP